MKNKINAIVFSKDRASQLKLFLESVEENAPDIFDLNVIVSHTDEDYDKAYGRVVNDPEFGHVNFVGAEAEFKEQVLKLLKTDHEYSCFFLDDDIIYKEVKIEDITSQIESDDDVVCFSLRLGKNTTKCYTLGADNEIRDIEIEEGYIKWDWTVHYLDFGYPFAMDGHVFRRKDIYKLTRKSKFANVEELEMALYDFAEMFPRNMMVAYGDSRLVNAPAGRVQQSLDDEMTMTVKESEARVRRKLMNNAFLHGDFINLESIDFSNIEGCHQKIDFGNTKLDVVSSSLDKIAIKKYGKRWEELSDGEQSEINESIDKIRSMAKQKEND